MEFTDYRCRVQGLGLRVLGLGLGFGGLGLEFEGLFLGFGGLGLGFGGDPDDWRLLGPDPDLVDLLRDLQGREHAVTTPCGEEDMGAPASGAPVSSTLQEGLCLLSRPSPRPLTSRPPKVDHSRVPSSSLLLSSLNLSDRQHL